MTHDTTMSDGAQPDPPLDEHQLATVRAADGVESDQEASLLSDKGLSADGIREEHGRLVDMLTADHSAPELADRILGALELRSVDARSALLHAAGPAPELGEKVLSAIGRSTAAGRDALLHGAGSPPELVSVVMRRTGLGYVRGGDVLLDAAGTAPELSLGVARSLELPQAQSRDALLEGADPAPALDGTVLEAVDVTGLTLRDVLLDRAGSAPKLSAAVVEQLDLDVALPTVGPLLRDAAGAAPELSSGVLSQLGRAHPAAATTEPTPARVPRSGVPLRGRWAVLALPAVAMAAAALLFVSQALISVAPTEELIAFSTDVANRIEIEDISTDVAAVVHVIPGDFDDFAAPTIIFIDELDEEDDSGDSRAKER